MNTQDSPIIVALDYQSAAQADQLVEKLDPKLCKLKVGKELFTREGPQYVRSLVNRNYQVFLDLKFHDIPNTVAQACLAAADLGVWMMNVHGLGGRNMMSSAAEALQKGRYDSRLIAVTILTSMDSSDLQEVGLQGEPLDNVKRLAKLASDSGLHGIVSSALEVGEIRSGLSDDFLYVTPGIRLADDSKSDQKRVMTPERAMQNGSSYLVIGRSVTQATSPIDTLKKITASLS